MVESKSFSYFESEISYGIFFISAKYPFSTLMVSRLALWTPSTKIFTVPSGSFIICSSEEIVPTLGRSFRFGSSLEGEFCAIKNIFLLDLSASSSE